MEITDSQEFTKFLPAAFVAALLAELSLMRKEKAYHALLKVSLRSHKIWLEWDV